MADPELAERLKSLPPYLFVEIDRAKKAARARGVDVIDFGVGDPDQPTPAFIIRALLKALRDPATHRYPLDLGNALFRRAVAGWYRKRFGVALDPDREVLPLIGSKEGLAHMSLAFVNPGDRVLVPDPAYPAYRSGVLFAGGVPVTLPLAESRGFLPDWDAAEAQGLGNARMAFLNYPNNPTSAQADPAFFERTVRFAERHGVLICHDNAYSELYEGRRKPPSFLAARGAKAVGVEFHSLSKTFNMTGWRVGFVCGNAAAVAGLAKVKSNVDSGVFSAIQLAGVEALKRAGTVVPRLRALYARRRKLLVAGLARAGLRPFPSGATFYVWCRIPSRFSGSMDFAQFLLEKSGIVATPGVGFGPGGEGFIRFTLTVAEPRIREALGRLQKALG